MARRRILSEAQRKFISEYVSNGQNGTQAALAAYDASPAAASVIASQNLQKDSIRSRILRLIEQRDIGPDRWAQVLENSMVAVTDDNKPDYSTQLKAVDLTAKLADAYPHESTKTVDHRHAHVHVQLTEPIEVTRFRVLHGRAPTERELKSLMEPLRNPDTTNNNNDTDKP